MISDIYDDSLAPTSLPANYRVLKQVQKWLQQGEPVWLCTIVQTWGSSPRPAGTMLALSHAFGFVGSLSGGCIEEALLRKLATESFDQENFLYDYAFDDSERQKYRLPCGGKITLFVERLTACRSKIDHFVHINDCLERRKRIKRTVALNGEGMLVELSDEPPTVTQNRQSMSIVFGAKYRMLILGAGEVSRYVAALAQSVDFDVSICDPRDAFVQHWQLEGVTVYQCLPDDLIKAHFSDPYCAIVALAHDPRVDDMALMQALDSDVFYIGAMGSVATTAARIERLSQLGVSDSQMKRLHSPIGFSIGSKTPPEIAIAIMAEVLAVRNQSFS